MGIEVISYKPLNADFTPAVEKNNANIFMFGFANVRVTDENGIGFDLYNMKLKCTTKPDEQGNTEPRWFIDMPSRRVESNGRVNYLAYFHPVKNEGEGQNPTTTAIINAVLEAARAAKENSENAPQIA